VVAGVLGGAMRGGLLDVKNIAAAASRMSRAMRAQKMRMGDGMKVRGGTG